VSDTPTGALGLDLGSTRFKAGLLDEHGALHDLVSCPAPLLRRDGASCVGDPRAYVAAAAGLLDGFGHLPAGLPAGLSCQRSSFVLETTDGDPLTPLISWQDTRAAGWCRANREFEPEFHQLSGLMLSAHYVGPKLAALAAGDPTLARVLRSGEARLRLLDGLLIEHLGGEPSTDPSMAARTGLLDIETLEWSDRLCERFGVHRDCLPALRATDGLHCETTHGILFRSSLADQSAGLVALTDADERTVLINLGTGAFVLRAIGETPSRVPGYLTGIIRADRGRPTLYALEGAISGSGPAIDRFRVEGTGLEEIDREPDLFAIPDGAGLGAPHWRPEIGVTFSRPESSLSGNTPHRALLEGLLFRVKQIYDDLGHDECVVLAGGLSRDPFVAQGLATLLDRKIERIDDAEATLCGAAIAAGGTFGGTSRRTTRFEPGPEGAYLSGKYRRWRDWLSITVSRS